MPDNIEFTRIAPGRKLWLHIERLLNLIYTPALNPLYWLGAIAIVLIFLLLATGVYLLFFYELTVWGAYDSVKYLTEDQWYLGGVMRSLHRYGSGALVLVMLLHAVHTLVTGRFRHWRWLAWVSGVLSLWVVWICGIFGYWLIWDERAQLIALLSAEMLERLPIFAQPLSLSFAREGNIGDPFFYIVFIIHFATTVFLFLLLWVHVSRIAKSKIIPPARLWLGILLVLVIFSFILPVGLLPRADLSRLPGIIELDWFYMFIYPALNHVPIPVLWALIAVSTVLLAALPWFTFKGWPRSAVVHSEACTGCEQCVFDCPYEAVYVRPTTPSNPLVLEAVTVPERCAGCGICVGACDFTAIDLPWLTETHLKDEIRRLSRELAAKGRGDTPGVLVFACAWGVDPLLNKDDAVRSLVLPCIGMVQPSMVALAIEEGARGVLISGCREGDCHYRRGNEWLDARLNGFRDPVLSAEVPAFRVSTIGLSRVEQDSFAGLLESFRKSLLKVDGPGAGPSGKVGGV